MDNKQGAHKFVTIIILGGLAVFLFILFFYQALGTYYVRQNSVPCDEIVTNADGSVYCAVTMTSENEPIQIIKAYK